MRVEDITRRFGSVLRRFVEARWRKALQTSDFSIISQNCIGGCIYHDLGMQFKTPTVDLLIRGEEFVRLVENLEACLSVDAVPMGMERLPDGTAYPVIGVNGLQAHAIHSESADAAVDAWNRRRRRVDYGNIFIIACMWDLDDDPALARRLARCGYPTVIFSDEPFDIECVVAVPERIRVPGPEGVPVRPALTNFDKWGFRHFEKFFDFVGWLNANA